MGKDMFRLKALIWNPNLSTTKKYKSQNS